jgi:uncharacterized membrane protein (UPF0127 family)
MTFKKPVIVLCFVFAFITTNCTASEQKFEKKRYRIETADKTVTIDLEIAKTDAQRAQGLMNRKSLPDGKGMLFVFDRDQTLAFWMKNTLIPLSIAFIASDGRILEIRSMQPLSEATIRSNRSARYALEVPRGWFDRAGIHVGDKLILN